MVIRSGRCRGPAACVAEPCFVTAAAAECAGREILILPGPPICEPAAIVDLANGKGICYNASVLKEEIAVLKKLSAKYFLISHDEKYVQKKEKIIAELEEIYSKRDPKESFRWI